MFEGGTSPEHHPINTYLGGMGLRFGDKENVVAMETDTTGDLWKTKSEQDLKLPEEGKESDTSSEREEGETDTSDVVPVDAAPEEGVQGGERETARRIDVVHNIPEMGQEQIRIFAELLVALQTSEIQKVIREVCTHPEDEDAEIEMEATFFPKGYMVGFRLGGYSTDELPMRPVQIQIKDGQVFQIDKRADVNTLAQRLFRMGVDVTQLRALVEAVTLASHISEEGEDQMKPLPEDARIFSEEEKPVDLLQSPQTPTDKNDKEKADDNKDETMDPTTWLSEDEDTGA
ncbi:hypothetical protein HY734_01840 [Candidatus Uhrbacteria bacterium]|nr:hypothetical protein [Candidatus Uhrbacteria bacterium]